ncbi:Com family DNA-binding transcriptional regulator [Rhodospirillum sp. A1_3_36]|uniref:Com family DNA-binding transcriptional regulator n=1 Tax=Rhodospirillum sp. A1_3_36 TaxID=3391666 RepID=UPI0039A6D093
MEESIRCPSCHKMLAQIEGIPYGRVTIKCPRCRATLSWRAVPSPDSERQCTPKTTENGYDPGKAPA